MKDDFAPRTTMLLLRAFLGPFWILQCYFKMRDEKSGALGLGNLLGWSAGTTADFVATTPLPGWMVHPYTLAVPWAELVVGLLILVGLRTRAALVFGAALLLSLDFGLMLQGKHDVVKSNTVILLTLLLALFCQPYDSWSVDGAMRRRRSSTAGDAGPRAP